MATLLRVDVIDELGRNTVGEHVWRVSGSRMLAVAGIPTEKIMLVARWGNSIVHRYIADSPLYNIAAEFHRGVAGAESSSSAATRRMTKEFARKPISDDGHRAMC